MCTNGSCYWLLRKSNRIRYKPCAKMELNIKIRKALTLFLSLHSRLHESHAEKIDNLHVRKIA